MSLSVADIQRWNSESVREVFHAADARAQTTLSTSRDLGALSVFNSWDGAAAEAAKHVIAQTRQDLDAHSNEAALVARAASRAADGIDRVQAELRSLENEAEASGLEIDPGSGRIVPMPGSTHGRRELQNKIPPLQAKLDAIVIEANIVDEELASAINMADGDTPVSTTPHDSRPEIQDALNKPLPQDPKQFTDLWSKLTPEEKDWLYNKDHSIGNNPGMAFAPPDGLGKDHYNRMHIGELQHGAQAQVDALAKAQPEWVAGKVPNPKGNAAAYSQWQQWKRQWEGANHTLDGYKSVSASLDSKGGIPRYLGLIDDQGHAAVAIGNPDTAKRDAVLVPGTGQDLARFNYSNDKSLAMYDAAMQADPNLRAGDVAVTTWMGYDRPMDLFEAASPSRAENGGAALDAYMSGMGASHVGAPAIDTVIGHSYGTTLVGGAATDGNHLGADNVIAVASPGMLTNSASGLSLDPGTNVYAVTAENDPIPLVSGLTLGDNPYNPAYGSTRLEASPGPSTLGIFPSIEAHSSYWDTGNPALADMGAIIAGLPPPHVVANPPYLPIPGLPR